MRIRVGVQRLAVAVVAVAASVVPASCSSSSSSNGSRATPRPVLGGPTVVPGRAPAHAMNSLERPVAARLERQVAVMGLSLESLDCPRWDGTVPQRLSCRAYVDGLRTGVDVLLSKVVEGRAVGFDARLDKGVLVTRHLEDTLRDQGWTAADCGDTPAYPAEIGSRIVCRVERADASRYLVAVVAGRGGAVDIEDYRSGSAGD